MAMTMILLSTVTNTYAQQAEKICTFSIHKDDIKVKWEAFKLPTKVGVWGQFTKSEITGETQGKSIMEIVKDMTLTIDSQALATKDASRDKKIADFFFGTMQNKSIKAITKKVSEENLEMEITLNGISRIVPFSYTFQNGNFKATGVLDIFDFKMNSGLDAINKACKDLHQGKTWNDVNLEVIAKFKKKCI